MKEQFHHFALSDQKEWYGQELLKYIYQACVTQAVIKIGPPNCIQGDQIVDAIYFFLTNHTAREKHNMLPKLTCRKKPDKEKTQKWDYSRDALCSSTIDSA